MANRYPRPRAAAATAAAAAAVAAAAAAAASTAAAAAATAWPGAHACQTHNADRIMLKKYLLAYT